MNMGGDAWGKWLAAGSSGATSQPTPLDTLKERYAKGEIGKDEFEQKKRDLGN